MKTIRSGRARLALGTALVAALSACSSVGGLGNVLGSVLGQGQGSGSQVSGYVQGIDTRNRQIGIQQSNGQTVAVSYDNQTQVSYNNQSYPVTSLENGDQVTLRIQQLQNGGYYTDLVQVNQSVSSSRSSNGNGTYGTYGGNLESIQGTVRGVDQNNAVFAVDVSNGNRVTVQLPSNLNNNDYNRFRSLRNGDYVRFNGVYLNNSRVELRQFF
jgi:hypothetical protein